MLAKRKRPTVVAIAAHPKMNIGDVWYEAEAGATHPLTLLSRPYWVSWLTWPASGTWWIKVDDNGQERTMSLADNGVRGFAYDGRPQLLIKDPAQCLSVVHDWEQWLINTDDGSFFDGY